MAACNYVGAVSEPSFRDLKPIAIAAYGPVFFSAIGTGAIIPVIALTARSFGGSVGTAALMVALLGVGQLAGDVPAGAIAARFGEKQALLFASVLEFFGGLGCLLTRDLALLAASILVIGVASAIFSLARQSYMSVVVPVPLRARAMSTLGGVSRIGAFIGPFIGAVVILQFGIHGAYAVDMVASVAAFALVVTSTDITADERTGPSHANRTSVLRSFARHRKIFLTLGVGVMLLSAARNARIAIVPLWAASLGLNAAHASLIVGIAGGVDMLLFYPGGALMDRRGRVAVAIPSMVLLGTGMIAIVFTNDFWSLVGVGVLLGIGNGIGSGLIMTLSADAAPAIGRAQFLACWRLMSDSGAALGPLLMSAITVAFPLAAASVVMGLVSYVGAGWLRVYVPRYDPILLASSRPEGEVDR
ncbi:MAG: major facilitator superfamily 1 [Aeromicrobium sp.]|nr:major facilitator superfamily 1 [Aeromicrobium sp.]